tara:strand:+ start:252 stop:674 length:423 start_codon:yes stop_codon:yes gene_type:complete
MFQGRSSGATWGSGKGRHRRSASGLCETPAFDCDEARAEAVETAEVLVARALVDTALAAKLGLLRNDRQAVGGCAAAFADLGIDEHTVLRLGEGAALALTATFSGAHLVVDQDGRAADRPQLLLDVEQFPAAMHADAFHG